MVEDLRRFLYFYMFWLCVTLVNEMWHVQVRWIDLVGIYKYTKNYQNVTNGLSAMDIFANWPRTDGQTDSQGDIKGNFQKSTFQTGRTIIIRMKIQESHHGKRAFIVYANSKGLCRLAPVSSD